MDRKVLGKGLAALIPEKPKNKNESGISHIKIHKIKANKYQPREEFDKDKLNDLVSSIREKGVIQPVLVRTSGDGYELIAGERRLRASRALGLDEVPALIKEVDDADMIGLALIENIQREELNPIEEAHAYQRLMDEFDFTQEKIGKAVGKDNTTISNSIRLLSLPKKIQDYLASGALSTGHAKVLLSLTSTDEQLTLSKNAVKKGLSVRALENMLRHKKSFKTKKSKTTDSNLRDLEEKLQKALGTKVRIIPGKKRGKIEIEYYSNSDLERITNILAK